MEKKIPLLATVSFGLPQYVLFWPLPRLPERLCVQKQPCHDKGSAASALGSNICLILLLTSDPTPSHHLPSVPLSCLWVTQTRDGGREDGVYSWNSRSFMLWERRIVILASLTRSVKCLNLWKCPFVNMLKCFLLFLVSFLVSFACYHDFASLYQKLGKWNTLRGTDCHLLKLFFLRWS